MELLAVKRRSMPRRKHGKESGVKNDEKVFPKFTSVGVTGLFSYAH